MVDWGAISQTYGWPWLTMVDHGLGKLCQPWLTMVCDIYVDSSKLSMVNHGYKHCQPWLTMLTVTRIILNHGWPWLTMLCMKLNLVSYGKF